MDKAKNNKSLAFGIGGILLQFIGIPVSILIAEESPGMEVAALAMMASAWIVGTILFIIGLSYYAQAKQQSGWWGLMGFLGLIGLIVLALLPDRHLHAQRLKTVPNRVSDLPTESSVFFRCLHCRYQLNGIAGNTCPECGQQFDPDDLRTVEVVGLGGLNPPWMGRWSLICGILGIVLSITFFCGPILGILGIIFGHVARGEIRNKKLPGGGVALAGLIVSYIATGLSFMILFLAFFLPLIAQSIAP